MKYLAVSTDFDGTLLKTNHTISQFTCDTVKDYINRGGIFVINSGRMCKSLLHELIKTNLTSVLKDGYVIGYNGAMIKNVGTGEIVFHNYIDYETAVKVIRHLKPIVAGLQIYFDEKLYCQQITDITRNYMIITGVEAYETNIDLADYVMLYKQNITKILAFAETDIVTKQINILEEMFSNISATYSVPTFLELTAKGVNKASGLQQLLKKYSLTFNDCIAFGDGGNDIQMLQACELGIAVSNATDEVKQVADIICKSCDEDGVAHSMKELCI